MASHRYILCFLALLITSCAMQPTAPVTPPNNIAIHEQHLAKLATIKQFALEGRLGVVTQKQGFSGGIHWQHQISTDNIDVFSPLGGKVANINKTLTGVVLTEQNGHTISANDAQSLTQATLGFALPLTGLSDWALGRPSKAKIEASSWDAQGRLLTLKQGGWDVSYENYADNAGVFLPNKVVLKSEKVNLKLLIEEWLLP